ncbi:MAG: sugar transferase, partial [Elusimicrobiaceae bacterium]|nr:sugar transferase [Elusimicrobiaceae bacterium]
MANTHRPYGPYERYFKRPLDILCALGVLGCFWWLFAIIAILVRIKLGSPVLFTQQRPGKDEKIFKLYKFRTMTDEKDKEGKLLPDDVRLTKFGKFLRSTSLDELPEVFNILKGEMSVVGPRPQLVRDMVFMSQEHRKRHEVRPGLTGLAQINGRNDIDWQDKLDWDVKYLTQITFWGDIKIIAKTFVKSFIKPEGITEKNAATATDYGDYLLQHGKVTQAEYQQKQQTAKQLL